MQKKILIVTNIFYPVIGGPATFGARLGAAMTARGFQVRIFCATPYDGDDGIFPFEVIRAGTKGNTPQRELSIRARLVVAVRSSDFVYCMGLEHQTRWACQVARKPFVLRIGGDSVWEAARNIGVTEFEPEEYYRADSAPARKTMALLESRRRRQFSQAAGVVYVSDYLRRLAGLWSPRRPPHERVVYNGLVVDATEARPASSRRDTGELRIVFVGRQTNWKGVDALLLAMRDKHGVHATIIGTGPVRPGNIDLARRLGLLERVEFIGDVMADEIVDSIASHHVLVLPSLYEGLSNTLLEAGAAGVACIASDRGGNPEVIEHGRTGLLVDPFDVDALSAAIARLRDDEPYRQQLALAHREKVCTGFLMDTTVQESISFLEQCVNQQ